MKKILLLVAVSFLAHVSTDNATDWCTVCKCSVEDDFFTLSCEGRSLQHTPSNWSSVLSEAHVKPKKIFATFDDNGLMSLNKFPIIEANEVHLSLRRCNLTDIESAAFTNIKSILYLNLGFNKLTGDAVRSEIFKGPYNIRLYEPIDLEILILESNQIHSLDKRIFEHIPKLKVLNLSNNPMKVIDAVTALAISSALQLEKLDLSYNGLKSIPNDLFRHLKNLRELDLSGNRFNAVPESIASVASSIEKLLINDNQIEEINDNSFLGLWRLEILEVGKMDSLTRVKAGSFAQLKSLQILHLCHNKNLKEMSHEAFRELKKHWSLKELYLNDNNLRALSGDMALWEELSTVNLENNPWNCDCDLVLNITDVIIGKLPYGSNAICMTPIEMSGISLKDLKPHHLCSQERLNGTDKHEIQMNRRMLFATTMPSNLIAGFVLVITVMSIGIMTGYVIGCLRRRLKNDVSIPVRYTNVSH